MWEARGPTGDEQWGDSWNFFEGTYLVCVCIVMHRPCRKPWVCVWSLWLAFYPEATSTNPSDIHWNPQFCHRCCLFPHSTQTPHTHTQITCWLLLPWKQLSRSCHGAPTECRPSVCVCMCVHLKSWEDINNSVLYDAANVALVCF